MADMDLSGSSNFVSLVYSEQPPPVDPKVLSEKLKREKQQKKEDEKMKRQREKEKEKEERKMMRMNSSPSNKRVTIEHVKYSSPEEAVDVKPREEREDEEGEKDKTDFRCGCCGLFLLSILFLLSVASAFIISYKLTEQSLSKSAPIIQEQQDGIVRIGALLSSTEDLDEEEVTEGRLPRNIEPIWYNLTTRIYLPGFVELPAEKSRTFESSLFAKFRVVAETSEIVLNSALLEIPEKPDGWMIMQEKEGRIVTTPIHVTAVDVNATMETVKLQLNEPLKTGFVFLLHVAFHGKFTENKNGPYISTYRTSKGEVREIAVTSCEPHYARRIFPCMDEPDRKAVFSVTIEHPKGSKALFNNMEIGTKPIPDSPDFVRTRFLETPKMSSYLFAFIVSDFATKEMKSARGVPVRAHVQPELLDHFDLALNVSVKMLDFYEKEFGIPYPLDKLDLVSVPDFTMGAMEDWGLIMFQEEYSLYNPKLSSALEKAEVVKTVVHEIAHQWFGNLVTMKWWSDIWLNEGFASFAEYVYPARAGVFEGLDEYFYVNVQLEALEEDAFFSSRPISSPVKELVQFEQLFDAITYSKATSVIRMIEDMIGEENFRKGLRAYLKKYAYSNAGHDDLIQSLKENLPAELAPIGNELRPFLRRYTKQNGYPVLHVDRPDTLHAEVTQEWFQRDSDSSSLNKHESKYGHLWEVPLFYEINQEPKPVTWMTEGVRIPSNQSDLLVLNRDSRGFYRVQYDPRSWSEIIKELSTNHTNLSALSRFRIIDDAFALAETGKLPYDVALDSIKYLGAEEDPIPILAATRSLAFILDQIGDGDEKGKVKEYIRRVLSPFYDKFVDWNDLEMANSTLSEVQLNEELIRLLLKSGHKEISDNLLRLFENSLLSNCNGSNAIASECNKLTPLIRSLVYCEGVKRGRSEEFNFILGLYNNEITAKEKDSLLKTMKCTRDTRNLKRLFQSVLDNKGEGIFAGKAVSEHGLFSSGDHELSKKIYSEFFYENHEALFKKYSTNYQTATEFVDALSANSKAEISEIEAFLLANPTMDSFEGFAKIVENGRAKLNWQRKYSKHLLEEFEKRANRV